MTLTLGEAADVEAVLYDALGRRVATLYEGELSAGTHALAFDGSVLPAGVYVVRLTAGDVTQARRVTLVR